MSNDAVYFFHEYDTNGEFSQWFEAKFVDETKQVYSSAEQYMMAQKAVLFGDKKILAKILASKSQKTIKALGRKIANFDEKVWDAKKFDIVIHGNMLKFGQNDELKKKLLATGTATIAEASPYDRIWGIGFGVELAKRGVAFKGQNLLGKALMETRERLRTIAIPVLVKLKKIIE